MRPRPRWRWNCWGAPPMRACARGGSIWRWAIFPVWAAASYISACSIRIGHVEVASGTGAGLLHKALANRHMARNVALSLPGFLGLAAVLAQSDLVATVPRHTATVLARQNGLVVGVCPIPVDGFAVCHYWHERVGHDPAHRWLRSAVRACLAFDGVVDGTTQIADPDTEILPRADTFKHDGPGSYSAV
ncbi:hypothetical protein E4T56_gene10482 [Termitomyces sp. T112]|nr:hypothetical protein E4T56_gene10482 [Termitomyces sp. T112]